jgi:hypothetical protein
MSMFQKIITDLDNIEQDFLGEDYEYYKQIKTPSELGMSGDGNVGALARDIEGIVDYVEVLVSGSGNASRTGQPTGSKFFLKTMGQCKDYKTDKLVSRSMYINNVPTKNLPIISNLTGVSFPEFRGIVPGILEDIYSINPLKMFRAFMEGSEPPCAEVSLETIDSNNNIQTNSAYVPISELQDLQNDGKIPDGTVTTDMLNYLKNSVNTETFINFCDSYRQSKNNFFSDNNNNNIDENENNESKYIKVNSYQNIYYTIVALLLLYITYKLMKK